MKTRFDDENRGPSLEEQELERMRNMYPGLEQRPEFEQLMAISLIWDILKQFDEDADSLAGKVQIMSLAVNVEVEPEEILNEEELRRYKIVEDIEAQLKGKGFNEIIEWAAKCQPPITFSDSQLQNIRVRAFRRFHYNFEKNNPSTVQ